MAATTTCVCFGMLFMMPVAVAGIHAPHLRGNEGPAAAAERFEVMLRVALAGHLDRHATP